ncbi:unnamed protein product [Paramecium sonneborni]|uniref:Uncharacterized protein n=1 Tax=Paramecium sonneborni TaxID=65129 RepID=A0A8S1LE10_9CILI|nr:unnamed protein product [Paramecium sonneborni]
MGGDHHQDHDSAISHEIKAEEIKRLQPFYQQRLPYILRPFASLIYHDIPNINTDNYDHKSIENYTESQIINRTVFALQKLQLLNPNFFTPQENRILSPLPSGIVSYTLQFTCSAMNAIYGLYLYKTWSFNAKSLGLWAVFLATQQVCLQYPNLLCETLIQWPRRRRLAKQYLEIYGPNYFHQIIDPRFSVHKLETLKNIA